jgi:hypothetical protein
MVNQWSTSAGLHDFSQAAGCLGPVRPCVSRFVNALWKSAGVAMWETQLISGGYPSQVVTLQYQYHSVSLEKMAGKSPKHGHVSSTKTAGISIAMFDYQRVAMTDTFQTPKEVW